MDIDIIDSIILGIVQGLTEFLPVSSSGHIELGKALLGTQEVGIDFTILVHVATALSSVIVFHKDIAKIFQGLFKFEYNFATRYAVNLLISAVPVAIVGLMFKDHVEALFGGNIVLVGAMLLVTAALLFLTTQVKPKETKVLKGGHALVIGLAQMLAIMPGISRSGSTIATALLMGIDKEQAAKFSFLMVLIPIFGQALLDTKDIIEDPSLWSLPADISIAGFLASFLSGLFACTAMLKIVKKGKLHYFSIYCVIVGIIAIVVGLS